MMKRYENTNTGEVWSVEEIRDSFEKFRTEIEDSKGRKYPDFEEYFDELIRDGELQEREGKESTTHLLK